MAQATVKHVPRLHVPVEVKESMAHMDENSSKVQIVDDLKLSMLHFVPPKKRFRLSLVNKTMNTAVDMSLRDVKVFLQDSINGCSADLTTDKAHENKSVADRCFKIVLSSIPSMLNYAGIWITSLFVDSSMRCDRHDTHLEIVRRMFEAINNDDACPHLMELSIKTCGLSCDDAILLRSLLNYVKKRQLKAKIAAADLRIPFLRSLSLIQMQPNDDWFTELPLCALKWYSDATKFVIFLFLTCIISHALFQS